jgi:hypothetical protein
VNRRFIVATALLVPALAFVSCKDSGNSNPAEPEIPNASTTKVAPSQASVRTFDVKQNAALASRGSGGFSTAVTGPAPHDPVAQQGVLVTCFSGVDVGPPFPGIYGGVSFTWANQRGCEINTFSGADDPDGLAAGAQLNRNRSQYFGKRLTAVRNLTFFYAGGPNVGGAPRFNIPIDECEATGASAGVSTQNTSTAGCDPGNATDGFYDGMLFADPNGCNDGDPYVGRLRVVQDPDCLLFYNRDGTTYPNFTAFKNTHPGARLARKFSATDSGTGRDEPADILIFSNAPAGQPNHYHVHRIQAN